MNAVALFKALADDSRLAVIGALLTAPLCCEDLAARLGLSPSTVSFHLKKLEGVRLVRKEKQQYYVVYHANEAVFDLALHQLVMESQTALDEQARLVADQRRQVLASFMPGGRLKKLPVQLKKRRIVLERLAESFKPGRAYPETETNLILTAFDDDYCMLRRMLVDEGLLDRHQGVYHRVVSATDGGLGASPEADSTERDSGVVAGSKESRSRPSREGAKKPAGRSRQGRQPMDKRKELKRQYLENPPAVGIFQFRNLETGKLFVGSSMNLPGALNRHQFQLEIGAHRNREFQADWKRLGKDRFVFEILDTLEPHEDGSQPTVDELGDCEKLWLEKLRPFGEKGYNEPPASARR